MTKKYVLHPGAVISNTDGQVHYISAPRLANLYGVDIKECAVADARYDTFTGNGLTRLFPRYNGDYTLPDPEESELESVARQMYEALTTPEGRYTDDWWREIRSAIAAYEVLQND